MLTSYRYFLNKNSSFCINYVSKRNVNLSKSSVPVLFNGLIEGNRSALARSITLIETTNESKKMMAQELLDKVLNYLKDNDEKLKPSFRIGFTGPPGTGKSSLIETFGKYLTEKGLKLAVLTVDPSSTTTGGSILGDKVRMQHLSTDPKAYIRSSPNKCNLGGVARTTLETVFLCEASNYEVIIIETVGVGQSEYTVSNMVDCMVLLIPPGSGDELQGIKKGIAEIADIIAVTKCDGYLEEAAHRAKSEYLSASKLMRKKSSLWSPKVVLTSAFTKKGINELWDALCTFQDVMKKNNELKVKRQLQLKEWFWTHLKENLIDKILAKEDLKSELERLESKVVNGSITPGQAADFIINKFFTKN